MIVPEFWAESQKPLSLNGRSVTIRRWGWSDTGQSEAERMAEARLQDAIIQIETGSDLQRREPKVPYNGADGVPIREEIVSRHGETVITRNSYGAKCLNTPNALFIDIDYPEVSGCGFLFWNVAFYLLAGLAVGFFLMIWWLAVIIWILGLSLAVMTTRLKRHLSGSSRDGFEERCKKRIEAFLQRNPDWHLRLYATPNGLRLLAMHRPFSPEEPAVAECFSALGADPIYVRMCRHQKCFRARVSAKPWRAGIATHLKPRPGVWPVADIHRQRRAAWLEQYDRASSSYAACRFLESLGSRTEDPEIRSVQQLHDELCQANSKLPIA
jgi:hypothetical protein